MKSLAVSVLAAAPVGRLLRTVGRGRVRSVRFPSLSVDVRCDAISDHSVALIFWGVYESAEVRFVRRFLRPDLDVIELGSSIGFVSSAISERLAEGRRLVCVEANESLLPVLGSNLENNASHLHARVLHCAIAYGTDRVRFEVSEENTGGHVSAGPASDARTVAIPAATLGQLLEQGGIAGEYALVSDIEGSEAAILAHDGEALRRCRQIVMELHDTEGPAGPTTVDDMIRELVDRHGFVLEARHGVVCVFGRGDPRG